jgi:sulfate adenylyltransferase large subunit
MGAPDRNSVRPAAGTDVLRFVTAGSVDDGKSTLIGRLLYDTQSIPSDQLVALKDASRRRGRGELDLALLTDGLEAEREQGITIDVAYRYFSTAKRHFVIADTPGHEQYTRNMVTGASNADCAVLLVDARRGILRQTRRHAFVCTLLAVPHMVIAVNKMDLFEFDEKVFRAIEKDLRHLAVELGAPAPIVIPVSSLLGDNIVTRSTQTPWYDGQTLLEVLETVDPARLDYAFRLPVQRVARQTGALAVGRWHDFRGYQGQIAAGSVAVGDEVAVYPGARRSTVKALYAPGGEVGRAAAPSSITLELETQIDISRGSLIGSIETPPQESDAIIADLCWFSERAYDPRRRLLIKHMTRTERVVIEEIEYGIDIETLAKVAAPASFAQNDLGRVQLRAAKPLAFDLYRENRTTGAFILIDEASNETVAAGMIYGSALQG